MQNVCIEIRTQFSTVWNFKKATLGRFDMYRIILYILYMS